MGAGHMGTRHPRIATDVPLIERVIAMTGYEVGSSRYGSNVRFNHAALVLLLGLVVACSAPSSAGPAATPVPPRPAVGAARSPRQAAIVEPRAAPGVFPRVVHDSTGDVVIPAK